VVQAQDRDNDTFRTVDEYLEMRRQNIGSLPSFDICSLAFNLPDEAFYHPVITQMRQHLTDLILIDNVSLLAVFLIRRTRF